MSEIFSGKGSCLCGSVRVFAANASNKLGACHCGMCRNWGGGPFLGVECGTEVKFESEENITAYQSSKWAERGFCKKCGSHLYYLLQLNNRYMIPIGLFDDCNDIIFDQQIFIDEKPQYYCFANETLNMTGAEVFAQYTPPATE